MNRTWALHLASAVPISARFWILVCVCGLRRDDARRDVNAALPVMAHDDARASLSYLNVWRMYFTLFAVTIDSDGRQCRASAQLSAALPMNGVHEESVSSRAIIVRSSLCLPACLRCFVFVCFALLRHAVILDGTITCAQASHQTDVTRESLGRGEAASAPCMWIGR